MNDSQMAESRKQKLINLGADALADALLDIAVHPYDADDLIEQLIATPQENFLRFKKKLSSLKNLRGFIEWEEAESFALELIMMLQDLESGVDDPLTGIELVAEFYETDSTIFEMCDDSSGTIGNVFLYDAMKLFGHYASRYSDKDKVVEIILKVMQNNNYGVRDTLIDSAGDCLPDDVIRSTITNLQQWASKEKDNFGKRHHLKLIESLARQLKDAKLFEETRIAWCGDLSTAALIEIARVYLESGDVETAHSRMKKISQYKTYQKHDRDELLKEIYQKQGDSKKLGELLFQQFRSHHTKDNLQALLDVIGHDKRDNVIHDETRQILKTESLQESDAKFLIAVGKIDEAEEYLLKRADQLNGDFYGRLLSLAEAMEVENRHLVTSLIYRSLLMSILERGRSKAYYHGIRYLKKLDKLASNVADWKEFNHHKAFKEQVVEAHGRKRSFWSNYEE